MRRRRARRGIGSWRQWAFASLCIGTAGFALAATIHFDLAGEGGAALLEVDGWARTVGLGISQVQLVGHRYTPDGEIFSALELERARSLLHFDSNAARTRIEQLPWVKTANIARVYPDGLAVTVVERTPRAVWRRPGQDLLLDATGRELGAVGRGRDLGLLAVAGDGAGPLAPEILRIVAAEPEIAGRLAVARLIAERRWSLELTSGARIELPADGAGLALSRLIAKIPAAALPTLLDGRIESIDLRSSDQMVIRRREPVERRQGGLTGGPMIGQIGHRPTAKAKRSAPADTAPSATQDQAPSTMKSTLKSG